MPSISQMEELRPRDVRGLVSYLVGGEGVQPTFIQPGLSHSISPDIKQRLNEYLISDITELGPGLLVELSGLPLPCSGPSPPAQALLDWAVGGPCPPPWAHHPCHWSQSEIARQPEKGQRPLSPISGRLPFPSPTTPALHSPKKHGLLFVTNLLSRKFSVLILWDRQPSDFSPSP